MQFDDCRSVAAAAAGGTEVPPIDIPESAIDAEVTLRSFLLVLQHGQTTEGDSNRFAASSLDEVFSVKKLEEIWQELGNDVINPIKFTSLSQHPHIQDTVTACYTYKFPVRKICHNFSGIEFSTVESGYNELLI